MFRLTGFSRASQLSFPLILKAHISLPAGVVPASEIALNNLRDVPGAIKKGRRIGRGPGSSKGKTAGKGHKGSWARGHQKTGGFEGGQSPLKLKIPKHGFSNRAHEMKYEPLNLGKLQLWIDQGRLDPTQKLDLKTLQDSKVIGSISPHFWGVKLLAAVRRLD